MTDDFKALCDLRDQSLVLWVFSKYKNLILKKAYFYSRVSKGQIDVDDFVSDVYLNLTYYLNFINIDKVKEDSFMFYVYVTYAVSKTLKQHRRLNAPVSIEQNNLENELVAVEQINLSADYLSNQLFKHLTKRQVEVIKIKQANPSITYRELGTMFGVRLQTIVRDVQLAKKTYNDLFGTNFQIGRSKKGDCVV